MSGDLKERIEKTVGERVADGAAFLDAKLPGWWLENRIDLDIFNMAQDCRCVIGFLSPQKHYGEAVSQHWLDLDEESATELGFWAGIADGDNLDEYDELQHAWTVLIRERRAGAER